MPPADPVYFITTGFVAASILAWAKENQGRGLRYALHCFKAWAWD